MKTFILRGASALGFAALLAPLTPQNAHALSLVSAGLMGGVASSTYTHRDINGTDVRTNYARGVVAGAGLDVGAGPVGIEVDLLYAKRKYGFGDGSEIQVSRAELPVLAHVSMGALRLSGGVYYAMGLGKIAAQSAGATVPSNVDFGTAGYERTDLGLAAGVGLSIPAGVVSFGLDLRYMHGLKDQTSSSDKALHRSFDLVASVWF